MLDHTHDAQESLTYRIYGSSSLRSWDRAPAPLPCLRGASEQSFPAVYFMCHSHSNRCPLRWSWKVTLAELVIPLVRVRRRTYKLGTYGEVLSAPTLPWKTNLPGGRVCLAIDLGISSQLTEKGPIQSIGLHKIFRTKMFDADALLTFDCSGSPPTYWMEPRLTYASPLVTVLAAARVLDCSFEMGASLTSLMYWSACSTSNSEDMMKLQVE